MIKCPNCGFENDDNCTFCAICGSSVIQDDFYVHNTTSNNISVKELNEKLITKESQKTKSFKRLDKATLAKEAAKIETSDTSKDDDVKEYKAKATEKPQPKKQESAIKADNKNNSKAEANNKTTNKAKIKSENKSDVKAESKKETNTKAENKTEAKTESKADKKVQNNNDVKLENKADIKAKKNSKSDNIAENKPDSQSDKKIENKTETDTTADTKAPNKAEAGAENNAESKTVSNSTSTKAQNSTTDSKLYNLLSKFLFDTKSSTKLFKQKDIDENCNLSLISYIPFLFFVPMIVKPCSGYTRYHGIQGLTLFIVSVVLEFFDILLSAIFTCALNDMPAIILTIIVTVVINLSILLFISTGIANAVKGEARELPLIGKYKLLKQYIY